MIILTLRLQRAYLLTTIWCFVPLAGGIWALITAVAWMPQRHYLHTICLSSRPAMTAITPQGERNRCLCSEAQ